MLGLKNLTLTTTGVLQVKTMRNCAFAVALLAVGAVAAPTSVAGGGDKDIVEVAVGAGKFKTLVAAVQAAELVETLKGKGPFTVFAPTDEAFNKLPEGTLDKLLSEPGRKTLKQILLYHVVPGKVTSKQVVNLKEARTAGGQMLPISAADGKVMIGSAQVVTPDIAASNGVIHVIDRVILPPAKQ
jgi:uncharacterized surface protein with fasciclin (FAS1) repeats